MKNDFLFKLRSKVKLKITGKNPGRFIKRLNSNNIELLKISNLKHSSVDVIIYKKDYNKLMDLKSIYDVVDIDSYGTYKIKKIMFKYKYLFLFFLVSIFLIVFLSSIIFEVEVIHNDNDIRNFYLKELEDYGLEKYKFVKSYDDIQSIKTDLLNKYRDKLEWIEITRYGTKYIVRLQERIIKENKDILENQNIVAKKGAILKHVKANNGVIVKNIDTYVNKGDVVISGNVYLNEELKDIKSAIGSIYGEVWYNVNITYPYVYIESNLTNEKQDIFVFKFLNKSYELSFKHFKEKKVEENVIFKSNYIPLSLVKSSQIKTNNIEEILTCDQAFEKAIKKANDKVNSSLKEDEHIINFKVLNKTCDVDKINVDIFFSVYENITDYAKIDNNIETN